MSTKDKETFQHVLVAMTTEDYTQFKKLAQLRQDWAVSIEVVGIDDPDSKISDAIGRHMIAMVASVADREGIDKELEIRRIGKDKLH